MIAARHRGLGRPEGFADRPEAGSGEGPTATSAWCPLCSLTGQSVGGRSEGSDGVQGLRIGPARGRSAGQGR